MLTKGFFKSHLFTIILILISVIVFAGLCMVYFNQKENDFRSLNFQEETQSVEYEVIDIVTIHLSDGNKVYKATFGESNNAANEFGVSISNLGNLQLHDIWIVQKTTYSCNKETGQDDVTEVLSLGRQKWIKPDDLMARSFKYLHQQISNMETTQYQAKVRSEYQNYLKNDFLMRTVMTAIAILSLCILVKSLYFHEKWGLY